MVLPLSSVSGLTWEPVRTAVRERCHSTTVITIAAGGSDDRRFPPTPGWLSVCVITTKGEHWYGRRSSDATFIVLSQSLIRLSGRSIAAQIGQAQRTGKVGTIAKQSNANVSILFGDRRVGAIVRNCHDLDPGRWLGSQISALAQAAFMLAHGEIVQLGAPSTSSLNANVSPIRELGQVGPYHLDIRLI